MKNLKGFPVQEVDRRLLVVIGHLVEAVSMKCSALSSWLVTVLLRDDSEAWADLTDRPKTMQSPVQLAVQYITQQLLTEKGYSNDGCSESL